MSESDEHAAQTPQKAGESGPVFVETLEGDADYWMSLTDAARVTRRQEVTIRRWVAAGSLPVRRQAVGINQRTRHVRASDLARLTPIVDPTAAITGAPANADLLSIPLQQAHLVAAQEGLHQGLAGVQQHLDALASHLQIQATAQQRAVHDLADQITTIQQQLREEAAQQRQMQTDRLSDLHTQMEAAHQQLQALMMQSTQEWQARVAEMQTQLDTHGAALAEQHQAHAVSLTQIQHDVNTQVGALHEEMQHQDVVLRGLQHDVKELHQQVQTLTTALYTVAQEQPLVQADIQQVQHTIARLQERQQQWQHHQTLVMTVLAARVRRQRTRRPFSGQQRS